MGHYDWLDQYLMEKPGAQRDFKEEWNATRYMVAGKIFAMAGGNKECKPIVTFKLEPAFGDLLRRQYPDIVPGYYMNKVHWNSMHLEGEVPDQVVRDMADQSHQLILASLSKKLQKEILEKA